MKVVVTGAAGFIGSTLVDRLLAEGHEVIGIDDLSSGRLANLENARELNLHRPGAFSLATMDVRDRQLADLFSRAKPDAVCHLAAQIDVRLSVADPVRDASVNVLGTINLLDAARKAGVKRFIFTSSGGTIYGAPSKLPVNERYAISPESPYGASKAAGELYLEAFASMYGIETVSLALANVYGPRQDPHGEAGVVAIFATAMLQGRSTTIFGDGKTSRDYLYVGDAVEAYLKALQPGVAVGRRLNIGAGVETFVADLHTAIAQVCEVPDEPVFAAARTGELQRIALDVTAARQAIDWEPTTTLEDGLAATVAWIRLSLGSDLPGH